MPRHPSAVKIPGVTSFSTGEAEAEQPGEPLVDDAQAEISRLRAQLASAEAEIKRARAANVRVLSSAVVEVDTPHGAVAKQLSSHTHLSTEQLTAMVAAGEVRVRERHVLCADGWWVNPLFS